MRGEPARADFAGQLERIRAQQPRMAEVVPIPGISEVVIAEATRVAKAAEWEAIVPAKFVHAEITDFEDVVAEALERWVDASTDGVNLILTGPVGTGKTHAAFAAVRGLFHEGATLMFTPIDRLLSMLDWKNPDASRNLRQMSLVDLLIVDDLGAQRESDWAVDQIYSVVNERWMEDRATVATTNLAPKELLEVLGERTYSRLVDAAISRRISGDDRRRMR